MKQVMEGRSTDDRQLQNALDEARDKGWVVVRTTWQPRSLRPRALVRARFPLGRDPLFSVDWNHLIRNGHGPIH